MTMNPFEQSTQQLLRFLTSHAELEVIDYIRQEIQHDAPDSVPTAEELLTFFRSPDTPTELDTYQQMLVTDKLLEYAEISLRTLCDLIRYQQLKELGVVHSAKEFIQLMKNRYPDDQWQEILGACDSTVFLGCTDMLSAEYFSDRIGTASVEVEGTMRELNTMHMTEIELNEQIESLLTEPDSQPLSRQTGMAYRREMKVRKNDRLRRIVTRSYVPHAGYIDYGFDGDTLLHSGKYIKYPKNSNCQRWIKRETSRRFRNCKELPPKGNYYRRLFDYWWTMY